LEGAYEREARESRRHHDRRWSIVSKLWDAEP
jgi:hypothetical protein